MPPEKNEGMQDERLGISISDLELTVRSGNALEALGIERIGQLTDKTEAQLKKALRDDPQAEMIIRDLVEILAELGLSFKRD